MTPKEEVMALKNEIKLREIELDNLNVKIKVMKELESKIKYREKLLQNKEKLLQNLKDSINKR